MKLTNLINFPYIVAWINSMPKIINLHLLKNHNSPSINTVANSNNLHKNSPNANHLKPFDTAFIAYYMMGLGDFE
ncbi:hypothetical protein [Nostoc sp. NMS8]|uniref:hypothetical protein n=1 Tax=Nostoc sp. NMS8 TaxID=2815392 RepID=UPI0025FC2A99|nr:hypothetical protein [Nostoc sp. NMS8]MBN3959223.1 hypothetical protein [Nostoc sp. NMS8]